MSMGKSKSMVKLQPKDINELIQIWYFENESQEEIEELGKLPSTAKKRRATKKASSSSTNLKVYRLPKERILEESEEISDDKETE